MFDIAPGLLSRVKKELGERHVHVIGIPGSRINVVRLSVERSASPR